MMKNDFNDKVTEYHILNAQLMSKAMLLLDNANDLMINQENQLFDSNDSWKYCNRNEFIESTLEYCQSDNPSQEFPGENNANENSPKENKFTFPLTDEFDPMTLYNGTFLSTSFSENEDHNLSTAEKNDLITIENAVENQNGTEHMVDRLLKTKISLKLNGCSGKSQKSANYELENLPVQNDAVEKKCVQVLKSKCEELNSEIQNVQDKLRKKNAECEELTKSNQTLNENKLKLFAQINTLKSQMIKKDGKISTLNSKIQIIEAECQGVKGERDSLAKSAKGASQEISGTETRLVRALKEISNLKEALNNCKQEEKDVREASKQQLEKLSTGLKMAEKREKTLLTTIKKQALLLDNLKKQINYLTSKNELDATEKQLDSILKWENN